MYKPSACLILFLAAPVLATPRSDFSDDRTAQRLWQDTRQTMQEQEQKVREYRLDIPSENIGQTAETDPEADQGEALFNAVNHSDWQTVRPLLERYTQQTEYDPDIALFARASLARGEGRWKDAKQDYETLLQRHPEFTRGRLDYARLLFDGRLNREATSEFMRLQNEDLPEAVKENIGHFRDSLNQRQSWQGSLSVGAVHNSNINEASGKTWCKTEIDGECWEEFSGDKPISANGIKYEAAAVRRWQIKEHHGIAARALGYGRFYRDHKDFNEHTLNLSAGYQFENHRHTFALAPLVEWNGSGGKTLNRAYGVRSEWNLDRESWTWNTEAEWKPLSYSDKTRLLDGSLFSVYNTLSYFPRNDLMLYGGIDWQQRKAKEPVDSYRLISARLGAAKMFEAGFDASASATFGIRGHRKENAVLEQRRHDKEQTYHLSIGADRWKFAGLKFVLSYKHRRVSGNTDWLYSYKQNAVSLSLVKSF